MVKRFCCLCLFGAALSCAGVTAANADTLFDSGVKWDQITGSSLVTVGQGAFLWDNFTLSSKSDITSIDLGLMSSNGESPSTIQYEIYNNSQVKMSSGAVNLFDSHSQMYGSSTRFDTYFNLSLTLDAGNYYLLLTDGTLFPGSAGGGVGWGFINNNPSGAWSYGARFQFPNPNVPEYSFDIKGTIHNVGAVPEPATMLLFGAGIAGLAAVGRRKRS